MVETVGRVATFDFRRKGELGSDHGLPAVSFPLTGPSSNSSSAMSPGPQLFSTLSMKATTTRPRSGGTKNQTRLTPWVVEVQHIPVLLEHVDLLYAGDGLHAELLERRLHLAVVPLRSGHRLLDDLSAGRALSAYKGEL